MAVEDRLLISLGSGPRAPEGWIATDINPTSPEVMTVDLLRPLPFPTESVEFFHAEQVIEHLDFSEIGALLLEIARCLIPGGVCRIATPDATRFVDLPRKLASDDTDSQDWQDWLVSANRMWGVDERFVNDWIFAVNRAFNWWGHRFLLTRPLLDDLLRTRGFLTEWQVMGESRFPELRGIERHGEEGGERQTAMQTMVVDAIKLNQVVKR